MGKEKKKYWGKKKSSKKERKSDKDSKPKAKEYKFTSPEDGTSSATFGSVLDHVCEKLMALPDMGDVVESLKQGSLLDSSKDKPQLETSQKADDAEKAVENAAFKEAFAMEMRVWADRYRIYGSKLKEAYGIIWAKHMSKHLQNRVLAHEDHRSADKTKKIDGNPVLLISTSR